MIQQPNQNLGWGGEKEKRKKKEKEKFHPLYLNVHLDNCFSD